MERLVENGKPVSAKPRISERTPAEHAEPSAPPLHDPLAEPVGIDTFAPFSRELRCRIAPDGQLAWIDGAWDVILGWSADEILDWHWEELVHPDDRLRLREAAERSCQERGVTSEVEARIAAATGSYRRVHWRFGRAGEDPSVTAVGSVAEQAGELRRLRGEAQRLRTRTQELESRVNELERRAAAVDAFAAAAAHQLVQPLIIAESSAIIVCEELGTDADPLVLDRLEAIGRSASRARRLIEGLLHDAHTTGRPLELEAVDVEELVSDAVDQLARRIADKRITVEVDPLPTVAGDPRLLAVVFDNLLTNALKYGPHDGGRICIGARRDERGWRFHVASDGDTIPLEDARRIFEPFERGSSAGWRQGHGLGLAICHRVVRRLGGTIGVLPGDDGGNVFFFVLPHRYAAARVSS